MNQRAKATHGKADHFRGGGVRSPHRVSGASYYSMAAVMAAAVFFIVWAVMHDGYDETPILLAGIASGFSVISFILFREIVLRRSYERDKASRRLAHHLRSVDLHTSKESGDARLSISGNEILLSEIRKKSDAAKVLGNLPEAHREVFELCDEYMEIVSHELARARPGSPRIPAFRKGAVTAAKRHRLHMLKWAELRAKAFSNESVDIPELTDKIGAAEGALKAVERAIAAYPNENALIDSCNLLKTYLVSAKVKVSVNLAEASVAKGETQRAIGHYQTALGNLNALGENSAGSKAISDMLCSEIDRLSRSES